MFTKKMKNTKKIIKNIFSKKITNLFIIPIVLLFFGIVVSLMFNNKISFSVLLHNHNGSDIKKLAENKLLKGEKIQGEFRASENFLGLVLLRFNQYKKNDYLNEDVLVFRIKDKADNAWYYENRYKSGLLENNSLFPFGFPVINNSKNKTYQFELESQFGNENNGVSLNKNASVLITGYQIPKNEIIGSKALFTKFLFNKFYSSFTNLDFVLSSFIYFLPFLFYIIWAFLFKKSVFIIHIFPQVAIMFIIFDIFIIKEIYLGLFICFLVFWLISILIYKLESSVSFSLSFLLILIWLIFMILNINTYIHKFNIWVYTLIVVGVVQSVIEERVKYKTRVSYKDFIGNFFKFR